MQTLNVKLLIQVMFGGARALYESLPDTPDRPKLNTIQKWEARGTLPRDGLVLLLNELEDREGAPVSLKPFICGDVTCDSAKGKRASTGAPLGIFD